MLIVVRSFGAVIVLLGAIILAKPDALKRVIEFFERGGRFYLVGALRVALGIILMASAGQFQWSGEILAIGILVLLSGVVTLFLGLDRVRATGEWWKRQPALLTRLWAVLAIAVGLFLRIRPEGSSRRRRLSGGINSAGAGRRVRPARENGDVAQIGSTHLGADRRILGLGADE